MLHIVPDPLDRPDVETFVVPEPPTPLDDRGHALWSTFLRELDEDERDPDAAELELLLIAAQAVDRVARLERACAGLGDSFVVTDPKTGGVKSHPLLASLVAAQRTALSLLARLGMSAAASARGTAAAQARWGR